ncbi:TerD family protein [Streptomyces sp. NPDC003077]|uniref:TerD family protein n=1 Tax=Streptomyces sp. NPDC003077 TaxID=3154443 RepID=UPI0033B84DCF
MNSLNKGIEKAQVALKWDASPFGAPPVDLDIIAGVYPAAAPYGDPSYLVHFGSRSPDGTITLNRDSRTGQGLGEDEVMTLELNRLAPAYGRVVVGVAIQQREGRKVFADVARCSARIREGYTELASYDFAGVSGAKAAVIASFTRQAESGVWEFHAELRGFDTDPDSFVRVMGSRPS